MHGIPEKLRKKTHIDLPSVLRTSPEPYYYFTETDVHELLTRRPCEYLNYVKDILTQIAFGQATVKLPPKQIFDDGQNQGDFRVMPCVVDTLHATTKTVKLVGTNLLQSLVPDQITVGKAFALHPTENFVSHIFEACLLSSARTGLCAALATDLLTQNPKKLTVIGAGRVGYYAALYVCSVANSIEEIELIDIRPEQAESAARALTRNISRHIDISTKTNMDFIIGDIITLATTSNKPICHPKKTNAQLVISLGADTNTQSELHSEWPAYADVFIDVLDSARWGDLKKWLEEGRIQEKDITDINTIMKTSNSVREGGQKIFISTGSALFDNLAISYMLTQT